ncbi:hypothetical protein M407DRAFT_10328 [Tulasnella calospora MUT 4182]|uniref:Uncharacterized protein n=1 Tax=Tulasnella calospora MUT 4182 TaxID=1051891 RepID=A0A0C3Q9Y9_9AGAM|nr:hypothetical protein M407DRAFT_10328 [Tulasnella calospora MUT 4182]
MSRYGHQEQRDGTGGTSTGSSSSTAERMTRPTMPNCLNSTTPARTERIFLSITVYIICLLGRRRLDDEDERRAAKAPRDAERDLESRNLDWLFGFFPANGGSQLREMTSMHPLARFGRSRS